MITTHQAAELRRRVEAALDTAWRAGNESAKSDAAERLMTDEELVAVEIGTATEHCLFRYIDHLAGKRKVKAKSNSR